jgi:hypothetical protein
MCALEVIIAQQVTTPGVLDGVRDLACMAAVSAVTWLVSRFKKPK